MKCINLTTLCIEISPCIIRSAPRGRLRRHPGSGGIICRPYRFQTPVSHLPPSLLCQRSISSHTLFVYRAFCWSLSVFAAFDPRVRRLVRRLGYHPDVTEAQRRRYGFPPAAALRYAPLDRCLPDRYVIHVAFPHVVCRNITTLFALPRIASSDSFNNGKQRCISFATQINNCVVLIHTCETLNCA